MNPFMYILFNIELTAVNGSKQEVIFRIAINILEVLKVLSSI